ARQRRLNEALEKFIHALAAHRHLRANRLIFAQLKIRNAFFGARFDRLLAGDQSELHLRLLQRLLHVRLGANRSVDHHLLDLRNLVHVFVAVLLLQRRHHPLFVLAIKFVFHLRFRFRRLLLLLFFYRFFVSLDQFHVRNVDRVRRHHPLFVLAIKFVFHLRFRFRRLLLLLFFYRFFVSLDQFHVRNVDRAFALGDLAARIVLRFAQVLLDYSHAFDQDTLLARQHFENL